MKQTLWMLLLITALGGCKKDNKPATNEDCKITSYSTDFGREGMTSHTDIVYDAEGRISRIQDVYESKYEFITSHVDISYAEGSIQLDGTFRNEYDDVVDEREYSNNYVMDEDGKVVSSTEKINGILRSNTTYTYSDGFLTRIQTTGSNYEEIIDISYNNGNVINVKSHSNDGYATEQECVYNISEKYQPYTATIVGLFFSENQSFSHSHLLYEQGYFGKLPQNQIANIVSGSTHRSYKYEKDTSGKLLTMSETSQSGSTDTRNSIIKFVYGCQ